MAPDVSGRHSPHFEFFPVENFLNLRPDCQKALRQSMKHTRDVFDTIGSEKFKAPSLLASPAGMLKYKGTGKLVTVKC